jgi:tetratricopeptide (TPR) repeat protein
MPRPPMKYNPAFLSDEELIEGFVVRHAEFESILETVRENTTQSNQHILVVGPRGSGKTTLVLRVAAEIRRNEELSEKWHPVVFAEESYQVQSAGEFWLEALMHLAQKSGDANLKASHKELEAERDEQRLRERALAQLLDFADSHGKRLLLIVENLNMLLGDQMSDDEAWALRHTLQSESRIMLLSTSTKRFKEVEATSKGFFELFKMLDVRPLNIGECQEVWKAVTGTKLSQRRIRPLQILTGGNPRLLGIISTFATELSFRHLMDNLLQLIDDHTEYFKSQLDSLAAVERKAYLALAEIWDPATARQVAESARLDVNKVSSYLARLEERGAVAVVEQRGRAKVYQVTERLYNIYYLMRRRGAPVNRVKALVSFMVSFYGKKELAELTSRIAEEACGLEPQMRTDHYLAFEGLIRSRPDGALRVALVSSAPGAFFSAPDAPSSLRGLRAITELTIANKAIAKSLEWSQRGDESRDEISARIQELTADRGKPRAEDFAHCFELGLLFEAAGRNGDAIEALEKAEKMSPDAGCVATILAGVYESEGLLDESEAVYKRALTAFEHPALWTSFGELLSRRLERHAEAKEAFGRAVQLDSEWFPAWAELGELLANKLEAYEEGAQALRRALDCEQAFRRNLQSAFAEEPSPVAERVNAIGPPVHLVWGALGRVLADDLGKPEEAVDAYQHAVDVQPDEPVLWLGLGRAQVNLGRYEAARSAFAEVTLLQPDSDIGWKALAVSYMELGQVDKAKAACQRAVQVAPASGPAWLGLAAIHINGGHFAEALECLPGMLHDSEFVQRTSNVISSVVIILAAAGLGREALSVLEESSSLEELEPLAVALRMLAGEAVSVAKEITEVAEDILKQIRSTSRDAKTGDTARQKES